VQFLGHLDVLLAIFLLRYHLNTIVFHSARWYMIIGSRIHSRPESSLYQKQHIPCKAQNALYETV